MHVGIDTVKLEGKYFYPKISEGKEVKKGDLLLEFDIEAIKKAGYSLATPVIISNTDDYSEIIIENKDVVSFEDELLIAIK